MKRDNADMPAIPYKFGIGGGFDDIAEGLTKREMFAMAAMQGLLASLTADDSFSPGELARSAVLNAGALLAELERTK